MTAGRKPEGLTRLQAGVITPANGWQWYTNPDGVTEPFGPFCRTFGACINGRRRTGGCTPGYNLSSPSGFPGSMKNTDFTAP